MLEEHLDWLSGGIESFETELDEVIDEELAKERIDNEINRTY